MKAVAVPGGACSVTVAVTVPVEVLVVVLTTERVLVANTVTVPVCVKRIVFVAVVMVL